MNSSCVGFIHYSALFRVPLKIVDPLATPLSKAFSNIRNCHTDSSHIYCQFWLGLSSSSHPAIFRHSVNPSIFMTLLSHCLSVLSPFHCAFLFLFLSFSCLCVFHVWLNLIALFPVGAREKRGAAMRRRRVLSFRLCISQCEHQSADFHRQSRIYLILVIPLTSHLT